jgi:hypothetical protein
MTDASAVFKKLNLEEQAEIAVVNAAAERKRASRSVPKGARKKK